MILRRGEKRKRILITAGPTREHIDPIRFISNYSTGTFGYEIAKEAKRRGNFVTLVSGPTALEPPKGIRFVPVESAMDMRRVLLKEFPKSDCVIMASAVSDWRAGSVAKKKLKRSSGKRTIKLVENPDMLEELGRHKKDRILVGFALETEDLEKNALNKLKKKNLDLIIANRIKPNSTVFGNSSIDVLIIDRLGGKVRFFNKSKRELAAIILDKIDGIKI